jgi:hypothetical protein
MNNPYSTFKRKGYPLARLALVLLLVGVLTSKLYQRTSSSAAVSLKAQQVDLAVLDKQCVPIETSTPKPKEEWHKSLWFVTAHHTFEGSVHRELIKNITKLKVGGKSFYASIKGSLRHCIGTTETASCSIGDLPTKQFENYQNKYVLVIQNPKTAMPLAANKKAIKYHGIEGQITIESWRSTRKDWFEKMVEDWIKQIKEWRDSQFDIGMYIVYEDLMDPKRGPEVVRELAKVFKQAGFDTIDDEQIRCAWMTSIGVESIKEYHVNNKYEFGDYIPGYTKKEKQFMVEKLSEYMNNIKSSDNGDGLVKILNRYIDDIQGNAVIDESV